MKKCDIVRKIMESTRINEADKAYYIEMVIKGWYTEKQIGWIWV